MGCYPKFNSIPLVELFQSTSFNKGILALNFRRFNNQDALTDAVVKWVKKNIKGHPVFLMSDATLIDNAENDVQQLWPSADHPNDFTSDLVNTFRNIFDSGKENEAGEVLLSNGDEYVVIFVQGGVDLRLITRMADTIRPVVFVTVDDKFYGNHNRFMSRWALDVYEDESCVVRRNQAGQSGITIPPS